MKFPLAFVVFAVFPFGTALAAPNLPAPPKPAAHFCAPDSNVGLVKIFMRLPPYVFRYFGVKDKSALLNAKNTVLDKKDGYIEIPYAGNSNHSERKNLYQWQLKLFLDSNGKPVVVVNSKVWHQTKVKPFLHVFRFDKNNDLRRTTAQDFPFKIIYDNDQDGKIPYIYDLPKTGDIIESVLPESDVYGESYRWTGRKFVRFAPKHDGER